MAIYTARQLITKSWYLSGIVSPQLETVSGEQIEDGLDLLNDILGIKTAQRRLVPTYTYFTIPLVAGQEKYFIPGLIDLSSATFNIGTVRFSMDRRGRFDYFATPRVDAISALPYSYELERVKGGADIRVYFPPQANYPLNLMAKFGLTEIDDVDVDLGLIYDRYYIVYLKYCLAFWMCQNYKFSFSEDNKKQLQELEAVITDFSPIDFQMRKTSSFTGQGGINLGDVNIGHGRRPS